MTDTQTNRPRLALFDLDHTLLPLDSDYEWGEFTIRIGWNDPVEFARRNDEFYAHYQAARSMCTTTCALPPRPCACAGPRPPRPPMRSSCAR
jgi:phosphoserine phosphatase